MPPKLIGFYPIYADDGTPRAVVHVFAGQEEACRQRAVVIGRLISALDGEPYTDNTLGAKPKYPITGPWAEILVELGKHTLNHLLN